MVARSYSKTGSDITYWGYISIDENGGMRMTRTPPGLNPGERMIGLTVKVPRTLFRQPQLHVNIDVNDNRELRDDLNVVVDDVAKLVSGAIGMEVTVLPSVRETDNSGAE